MTVAVHRYRVGIQACGFAWNRNNKGETRDVSL